MCHCPPKCLCTALLLWDGLDSLLTNPSHPLHVTCNMFRVHTVSARTHDSEVLHVRCSLHLLGELVAGELAVDGLLVARADEAALRVQEHAARTEETHEEKGERV